MTRIASTVAQKSPKYPRTRKSVVRSENAGPPSIAMRPTDTRPMAPDEEREDQAVDESRDDPLVVLVGEVRDPDPEAVALEVAERAVDVARQPPEHRHGAQQLVAHGLLHRVRD